MRLWGLIGRVVGLLLLVASALLWTSVLTWSVTDPSLTHATGGEVKNTLGPMGAIAADLVLEALGLGAALALLAPMLWGLSLMSNGRLSSIGTKLPYYVILVVSASAALSSLPRVETWPMAHGLGGIAGDVAVGLTQNLFAMLSPERASLATSLFLTIVALASFAPGIGLERRGPLSLNPLGGRRKSRNHTAADDEPRSPYGRYAAPYHPYPGPHTGPYGHAPYPGHYEAHPHAHNHAQPPAKEPPR